MGSKQRLTLEEIGHLAGVSRSTVSRVVNGGHNVSPDVRARVDEVIRATRYRPHAAARSLASKRTGVLGLVIPSQVESLFDDPYFGRLILGVSKATNAGGDVLSLFIFHSEDEENSIYPRVISPGLVDGVIVTATRMGDPLIERLVEADLPHVVVGRPETGRLGHAVDTDNREGARRATLHLAGLGYRRIGSIAAPGNTAAGLDRLSGFSDGLTEAGLDVRDLIVEGDWTEPGGYRSMQALLDQRPDAVFVASDTMAVGALRALRDAGVRCPEDIGIVSFDGLIPPEQTVPALTSVVQPVIAVGERAARLLRDIIDGTVTEPEYIVLRSELVVRESCGARLRAASGKESPRH